ncbi:hypothetical protein [Mesobacillus maritimus]|uniref:hypothetical protein n=1 Tax=Mesobacillus maritimus TaxID=1643336 RepID=UPI00384DBC2E
MKKYLVYSMLVILVISLSILLTPGNTDAVSKKALEEIVMEQQMAIEALQTQLLAVEEKVEALAWNNNENMVLRLSQSEDNINRLMKIHGIDEESIQEDLTRIPEQLRGIIREGLMVTPLARDYFSYDDMATIGNPYYNIFEYISEKEIQELVRNIYYEMKTDEMNFTRALIYIETPEKRSLAMYVDL